MTGFLIPAMFAGLIAFAHVIAGGREIAQPLLRQTVLPLNVTLTHYFCWHMATISLLALSGAYGYAAIYPDGRVLAIFATMISALFCVWGLALVIWKRQPHRDMPQWILFAGQTASALWVLLL